MVYYRVSQLDELRHLGIMGRLSQQTRINKNVPHYLIYFLFLLISTQQVINNLLRVLFIYKIFEKVVRGQLSVRGMCKLTDHYFRTDKLRYPLCGTPSTLHVTLHYVIILNLLQKLIGNFNSAGENFDFRAGQILKVT